MRSPLRPAGAGRRRPAVFASAGAAAALLGLVLLATACGDSSAKQDTAARESAGGGMTARLTMSPDPAPVMRALRLSVALTDVAGQPVSGRTIAFDLSMPSMTMAPNRPQVSDVGGGVYEATAMLSMAGQWQLMVEIDAPDQRLELPFTFTAD